MFRNSEVEDRKRFREALVDNGVKVPKLGHDFEAYIEKKIACVEKMPLTTMTSKTGWFDDKSFVLPKGTISEGKVNVIHASAFAVVATQNTDPKPTLEDWKKGLARITNHSSITKFAIAHAFSGPLLKIMVKGSDIPMFNFRQNSSSGKTSMLVVCQTVFDKLASASDLATFDATERASEDLLMAHNDTFLAFDEENRSDDHANGKSGNSRAKNFAFFVASGTGRKRSKTVQDTLPNATWRLAIATSSNRKTSNTTGDKETLSPSGVRWIDILVGPSGDGGIFDSQTKPLDAKEREDRINRAKELCLANSTVAGAAWIQILVDPQKHKEIVKSCHAAIREFNEKYEAGLSNPQLRILEKFALVYAVASILPEYELVPWTTKSGKTAVCKIYQDYMRQHRDQYRNWDELLAKLTDLTGDATIYPAIAKARKLFNNTDKEALGFETTFNDQPVLCLTEAGFEDLSRQLKISSVELQAMLREKQILQQDANAKWTINTSSPFKEGRQRFKALNREKLKALASKPKG
jgi:hypothetical protein